eukprot:UN21734
MCIVPGFAMSNVPVNSGVLREFLNHSRPPRLAEPSDVHCAPTVPKTFLQRSSFEGREKSLDCSDDSMPMLDYTFSMNELGSGCPRMCPDKKEDQCMSKTRSYVVAKNYTNCEMLNKQNETNKIKIERFENICDENIINET